MLTRLVLAVVTVCICAGFAADVEVDVARGGSSLIATDVRIKSRPATVRVVVDLAGPALREFRVFLSNRPRMLERGTARIRVEVSGTRALVRDKSGRGVSVELTTRARALLIEARSRPHRFKYVSYRVRAAPQRLAIDLWRSAPPRPGTTARFGPRGCLTIVTDSSKAGRLIVSGEVGRLFEATFVVRVRRADGRVVKRRIVTMEPGAWRESIGYRIDSSQPGTVEAVAESAKDGSLACLAQRRVRLQPR